MSQTRLAQSLLGITAEVTPAGKRNTAEKRPDFAPSRTGVGYNGQVTQLQMEVERLQKEAQASVGQRLPVETLDPNPWQPRTRFDAEALASLRASIKAHGVMQPIVARRHPAQPDRYQVIAGERRLRCSRDLGLPDIPAVLLELSDADMAALALVENLTREDLADFETYRAIKRAEAEFQTKRDMAEALNISRPHLYRLLSFGKLPQYALDSLEQRENLLSAKAAEAMAKFLADAKPEGKVAAEAAMQAAWEVLLAGDISHMDLVGEAKRRMASPSSASAASTVEKLIVGGKPVGLFKDDKKNFTIKVGTHVLTTEQKDELRALVHKFIGPRD